MVVANKTAEDTVVVVAEVAVVGILLELVQAGSLQHHRPGHRRTMKQVAVVVGLPEVDEQTMEPTRSWRTTVHRARLTN